MTPEKNAAAINAPPLFTVRQSSLPNRIGISIEEIRARRDALLTEGLHWQKEGHSIVFTAEAEKILFQSLALPLPANAMAPPATPALNSATLPPAEKNAAPAACFVVSRSAPKIRNRHIVEMHREGADVDDRAQCLLLWVKDNTKFRPGHRIPQEHTEPRQEGQFTYIAVRPPRG